MKLLTREAATQSNSFKIEKVDVTEWGEIDPETGKPEPSFIYVREVTVADRDKIEQSMVKGNGVKQRITIENLRARMAVIACCDENYNPIFKSGDETWLAEKACAPMIRIYDAYQRLNNFSPEDEEELLKN